MNTRPCDPHDSPTGTFELPLDELSIRRERKRLGHLTPAQVRRLIMAAELRKKSTQGERDE